MESAPFSLRDVHDDEDATIALIAHRMRETLIEIEGRERGESMYSMEWLIGRVHMHLNPAMTTARVVVAENAAQEVLGHTIFRIDRGEANGEAFGLISTTYVIPEARREGVAQAFLDEAIDWCRAQGLHTVCTWTSSTNTPLIRLYTRSGFETADSGPNDITGTLMLKLEKRLTR